MKKRTDPWEAEYIRIQKELPKNEIEKKTLEALFEGASLSDCYERFWNTKGFSYEDFIAFMKSAGKWETGRLCKKGYHSEI